MQVCYLLCFIKEPFEYVCTLKNYQGKEEKTFILTCEGKGITAICPNRLKMFTNLEYLYIVNTSLEALPDGIEHLYNLKGIEYHGNNGIGMDKDVAKLSHLEKLEKNTFIQ